jgi:hypothetical protein
MSIVLTLGLARLVNNNRFVIFPWAKVPELASFLLGKISRSLAEDWHRRYRQTIVLAETFVELGRFQGTCYRGANWICLGHSLGTLFMERNVPVPDCV